MASRSLILLVKAIDQASATLRNVKGEVSGLGSEAATAAQEIRPLGVALAAVGAVGVGLITTAALTAARVEVLGTVLGVVGDTAGYTEVQLASFEGAVTGLGITTGAARQGLIQLMQAQLDLTEATDLASIAQDAAVIANVNSSAAYETLIRGILTGRTVLLKSLGLTVDFNAAYGRMAEQLGKTTAELTAQEKMQARLNEVKRAGVIIEGTYEAAMGDVGKKLTSMPRYLEEAANALGQAYLPAMEAGVDATTDMLKAFIDLEPGQQAAVANFIALGTAITVPTGAAILLLPQILAIGTSLGSVVTLISDTGFALQLLGAGATTSGLGLAGVTASAIALAIPLAAIGLIAGAAYLAISNLNYTSEEAAASMQDFADVSAILNPELAYLQETTDATAGSAQDLYVVTSNLADGWTGQYSPALINARELTTGWEAALLGAGQSITDTTTKTEGLTGAVVDYTSQLNLLKLSIEGPVAAANESYLEQQGRINTEIAEAQARLAELDGAIGSHRDEIGQWQGKLGELEGDLVSLDAQHRESINRIVYDMMTAQLAVDGWTEAESILALETARAMGIVDEETYGAGMAIIGAFQRARNEGILPTVSDIMRIGTELSGLGPEAEIAGPAIARGMLRAEGAFDTIIGKAGSTSAAIGRIPRDITVTTHWREEGRPPSVPGGPQEGWQHGTDYVPQTGFAYLHRGEAVLTVEENRERGRAGRNGRGERVTIHNHFGRESVRSDEDIRYIIDAQQQMLEMQGLRTRIA